MAKTVALGTILRVETSAGPTYTAVGNLTSISVPGPVKAEIDVTDFDSVAAEFLAGLPDNGELSLSGWFNYANAGQLALLTDAHNPNAATKSFNIQFVRQAVQFTFQGWVKSFVPNAGGPGEAYTFDATLRVTGAVTIAAI